MTLFRGLFALLLVIATPLHAATGDSDWLYRGSDIARDPAWTFGTLPNGLRYAVRRNALPAGQVSIRIRIDAGALNEADSERGWAHFVEHMLFRGTRELRRPARRAADLAEARRQLRQRHQRHAPTRPRPSTSSICPTPTAPRSTPASTCSPRWRTARRSIPPRSKPSARSCWPRRAAGPSSSNRVIETSSRSSTPACKFADRDTIGTDATLNGATAAGPARLLRALVPARPGDHRSWSATPIPAMMEELIAHAFRRLAAREAGAAPSPIMAAIAESPSAAAGLAYPGAPHAAHADLAAPL